MLVYYVMYVLAAIPALQGYSIARMRSDRGIQAYWSLFRIVLIILIGFRYEVGGDWFTYLEYMERSAHLSFLDITSQSDPGYVFFNILCSRLGLGVTGVNSLSAIIIVTGLFAFLKTLPRPWLGLTCAIPYLVIVVAMGYTRQSVALGFIMLAIVAIRQSRLKTFLFWVVLGASFHKTAVFLLPLAALISTRWRVQKIGLVGLATAMSFELFLSNYGQRLYDVYINMKIVDSDGALVRLIMNAIPAAIFILLNKRMDISASEQSFWKYVAWISLIMVVLLYVTSYSTALDRMALYFIPLQLVVFSNLPNFSKRNKQIWVLLIVIYYALILFVWLNFAKHARYWIPYDIGIS